MSWLSSFLHPGRAYDKAGDQVQQYWQQAQGYLNPYIQQGQQGYGEMANAMNALLNPETLQNKWAQGYETSPAALQAQEFAKQSGLDSASAMGLMGSTPALSALQAGESQIALQDRQNYLDNLMQKYLAGAGLAQNIYGIGANAAGQAAQGAMNTGQNMAQMAYGKQAAGGNMFGNLLGTAAGLAGSALGGPIGGAIANKYIGSWSPTGG